MQLQVDVSPRALAVSDPARRVLVVDDDPVARAVQRDIFALEGWRVSFAGTVEQGWQAASDGEFDVVVCDLRLPDGDGLDLISRLRGQPNLAQIPIIVVTGRTGGGDAAAAFDRGATDFVEKPFDADELLARCRSAIRAHDSLNRLVSSERQLRLLADSAADLVVVITAAGTIRYVSPSSLALLGWAPSEIEGRSASKLFEPIPVAAKDGSVLRHRRRVRRASGDWIWVDSVVRPVEDDVVVWGLDVTDQVVADHRQTAVSRARYAILSETGDSRAAVCASARRLTRASLVALLEPVGGDRLVVTSCSGSDIQGFSIPLDSRCLAARSFRGSDVHLAGAEVRADHSDGLLWAAIPAPQRSKITGAIHLPVVGPRGPRAVMALALSSSSMEFDRESLDILRLLAGDAALAIEREDSNRMLAEQANRDPLTGLVNRRILDQAVNRALASFDGGLAFALLDIDHFKEYNDAHGHQAGDRVLVVAAGTWSRLIRPEDTLARFGGEEFALVMPGCALDVAEGRIAVMRSSLPPPVTASAGVTSGRAGDSFSDIVARADLALYRAKAAGRDCTVRG